MESEKKIYAKNILLADGWARDKTLTIVKGVITEISSGYVDNAERIKGSIIPGMVNCHSHAFQRAFAGFSEQGSEGQDSFWTWRKVMYKFLAQLTTENVEVIASQLYIEMLKMGYTRVAEFHYLHHEINGSNHSTLSAMAEALFKAAKTSGIGLTMLPVLYQFSGFGAQVPNDGQKRFINSTKQFNKLVSDCFKLSEYYSNTNVGIAPHSLRAVDKESLMQAVAHVRNLNAKAPIHIHIAEQQKEVDDCLAYFGQRPVQWLLDNMTLDAQWCLIHATHINEQERKGIIATKAIAGICPTTEANLGDGIFPTTDFFAEGGTLCILLRRVVYLSCLSLMHLTSLVRPCPSIESTPSSACSSLRLLPILSRVLDRPSATSWRVAWPLTLRIFWLVAPLRRIAFQASSHMSPSGCKLHLLPKGF